jgi:hypothetical protein
MKKLIFLSGVLAAFLLSCGTATKKSEPINTLSKAEIKEGWKLLFDGKSTDQWKLFNKSEAISGWKIVDGILENSGVGSDHGGDIITKDQFENFELSIEWNVSPQSNSGVFIHVQEGVSEAIYESGPEYQLIDDAGWPEKLEEWQKSGANYAMQPPANAKVNPAGEWNLTRIVVNGPHVEHWLNGVKVVEYELWSDSWKAQKEAGKWKDVATYGIAKTGHIGLQDHGGLTKFRNIKIKAL